MTTKFRVGDKVRIKGGENYHCFKVGDIGTIIAGREPDLLLVTVDNESQSLYACNLELVEGDSQPTKAEAVNNPAHYGTGKIECIEYIKDFLNKEEFIGYLRGNIAKYLHRWRYKNGVEDLKKAQWYLKYLIEFMGDTPDGK